MNILITGELAPVCHDFTEKLIKSGRVIASSNDINESYIGQVHKIYNHVPEDEEFSRLFSVHSIDTVIFFFDTPKSKTNFNALSRLDSVLEACGKFDVKKVVVIFSNYINHSKMIIENELSDMDSNNAYVLVSAAKSLCDSYLANKGIDIITITVPLLFGDGENKSFIGNMIFCATTRDYVTVDGEKKQIAQLLSQEDLGEFVFRMLLEWPKKSRTFDLCGASTLSFEEIGNIFATITHSTRVTYSDKPACLGMHSNDDDARGEYDWIPIIKFEDEIRSLTENVTKNDSQKKPTLMQKVGKAIRSKSFIIIAIELALGFILMEFLNGVSNAAVQFKYIDFRLLFVVLIAIVHGMKPGIVAAGLSCISVLMAYLGTGVEIGMILYNIDNWLPFTCYLMAGTIIGYTKDKKQKEISFVTEENDVLKKRYTFLVELYDNSLLNKEEYKKQIMSYRNSFGRIFEVTRRLNSKLPDEIFKEAIITLEDILDNKSISIYTTSKKSGFARLVCSSKKIMGRISKSINLKDYDEAMCDLQKGEVWINLNRIVNYPDYIFPIFKDDELVCLIMISKVTFDQMAIYFGNLVKIICNLIEDSLIRALDYIQKLGDEIYLPASTVMNKSAFKELLIVREQMEKEAISEYAMLKFSTNSETIVPVANEVKHFFRDNDVFGQGEDDNLYIILSGSNQDSISLVLERLKKGGISSDIA